VITFATPSASKQVLLAPYIPLPALSVSQSLLEAWAHALDGWHDSARHDIVLGVAAKQMQLAWLAARYREIATARPHDSIAPARLDRVKRAVLATMPAEKPHQTKTRMPYRGAAILLVVGVLAMVAGLWLLDLQSRATMATTSSSRQR
jgi:hypothetical protein